MVERDEFFGCGFDRPGTWRSSEERGAGLFVCGGWGLGGGLGCSEADGGREEERVHEANPARTGWNESRYVVRGREVCLAVTMLMVRETHLCWTPSAASYG